MAALLYKCYLRVLFSLQAAASMRSLTGLQLPLPMQCTSIFSSFRPSLRSPAHEFSTMTVSLEEEGLPQPPQVAAAVSLEWPSQHKQTAAHAHLPTGAQLGGTAGSCLTAQRESCPLQRAAEQVRLTARARLRSLGRNSPGGTPQR